ncbi:MAG: tetratricopeptide repeat protein [Bacteroidetes bacterium]|nr:tetratricopeptide repeat protein [Bacteroidota bacterium]
MKNLDRIERYVNHEMDEDVLWEFKKELENNPQLAQELAIVRGLKLTSQSADNLKLMGIMEEIRQQNQPAKQRSLVSRRTLAYAASLLLLATLGILLWQNVFSNRHHHKLYAAYYQPEPVSFAVRSTTMGSDQPVMLGLNYFEQGNFAKAIESFNQSPGNAMGKLYNGLANMELGNFEQAIAQFKSILAGQDNLFTDQAAWYLSMCYLKTNKTKELESMLRQIASGRSIYKTKAQKLMKELGMHETD